MDVVSPFQLYFNPLLILKQFQVRKMHCSSEDYQIYLTFNIAILFISGMETNHHFSIFRKYWFQFSIQHDIHISLLSYARRRVISFKDSGFCNDVFVWFHFNDCILFNSFLYISLNIPVLICCTLTMYYFFCQIEDFYSLNPSP